MRGKLRWLVVAWLVWLAPPAWAGDPLLARQLTDRGIQLQQAG